MSDYEIRAGDALDLLKAMPSESVQCCVTSPPYWGLRDYGTASWDGGDSGCAHRVPATGSTMNKGNNNREGAPFAYQCGLCGALRVDRQLGLEATPEEYVEKIVAVFEEVRRVLRGDGTLWLNLGDCYATGAGKVGNCPGGGKQGARWRGDGSKHDTPKGPRMGPSTQPNRMPLPGLKPKDLVGIPWRVAFALQAAGWWLRSDIIWAKPNPMPESVTDRPTKAHEYVFLLAKNARYFFDGEAVKEASAWPDGPNSPESISSPYGQGFTRSAKAQARANGEGYYPPNRTDSGGVSAIRPFRNIRSVWSIATEPFPEAHFATFPTELARRCILAGCPKGGTVLDPFCGAGTTGLVANRLGRAFIGIELNPEYAEMARERIRSDAPLFNGRQVAAREVAEGESAGGITQGG